MAYDEALAARIRAQLGDTHALTERKMFGGIGWMISGHMAVGAGSKGQLIVRSVDNYDRYIAEPGAEAMHRGDKPMMGWILVAVESVASDDDLHRWIARGRAHAESLPPKV